MRFLDFRYLGRVMAFLLALVLQYKVHQKQTKAYIRLGMGVEFAKVAHAT